MSSRIIWQCGAGTLAAFYLGSYDREKLAFDFQHPVKSQLSVDSWRNNIFRNDSKESQNDTVTKTDKDKQKPKTIADVLEEYRKRQAGLPIDTTETTSPLQLKKKKPSPEQDHEIPPLGDWDEICIGYSRQSSTNRNKKLCATCHGIHILQIKSQEQLSELIDNSTRGINLRFTILYGMESVKERERQEKQMELEKKEIEEKARKMGKTVKGMERDEFKARQITRFQREAASYKDVVMRTINGELPSKWIDYGQKGIIMSLKVPHLLYDKYFISKREK